MKIEDLSKTPIRTIPGKVIKDFLTKAEWNPAELADILGLHPTTIQRLLTVESTTKTPTGTVLSVLGLLIAMSGIPSRVSQFAPGYRLFKVLKEAIEEADPESKAVLALRLMDDIEDIDSQELEAKILLRAHKIYEDPSSSLTGLTPNFFLIQVLDLMGRSEELQRIEHGGQLKEELRISVIQDHFARKRNLFKRRLEPLERELEKEAAQYETHLNESSG